MTQRIETPRLNPEWVPVDIIASISRGYKLPIAGGWGYGPEDAVSILKSDTSNVEDLPLILVGVEHYFIEKRIYSELIVTRHPTDRYCGIEWKILQKDRRKSSTQTFDWHCYEVSAIPESVWEMLKSEWEGPKGYGTTGFDIEKHLQIRDSLTIKYNAEFWFDITMFDENCPATVI